MHSEWGLRLLESQARDTPDGIVNYLSKTELLELSLVDMPANQIALKKSATQKQDNKKVDTIDTNMQELDQTSYRNLLMNSAVN